MLHKKKLENFANYIYNKVNLQQTADSAETAYTSGSLHFRLGYSLWMAEIICMIKLLNVIILVKNIFIFLSINKWQIS